MKPTTLSNTFITGIGKSDKKRRKFSEYFEDEQEQEKFEKSRIPDSYQPPMLPIMIKRMNHGIHKLEYRFNVLRAKYDRK